MARVLYFSTHEPLEYDDIKLFSSMGHTVFSTGQFCPANEQASIYREAPKYLEETSDLVEIFHREKCQAKFMDLGETQLTANFLNAFDYIISIQDVGFIQKYWDLIDGPVVIWRTVGQAIEHADAAIAPYREKGLKIVRWSDREQFADTYIGHDMIIRAYKDPSEFGPWTGESGQILTFSNSFAQRYPIEQQFMERVCHLLDYKIGGSGNESLKNTMGLIKSSEMNPTLNKASAYFYCHGSTVPYTLNFIEAMMSGIPVLAAGRNVEIHNIDMRFNEINDFIINGKNGFLFKSEKQARGILMNLQIDKSYAAAVGAQGRETAIRIFGKDRASKDWSIFFAAFKPK